MASLEEHCTRLCDHFAGLKATRDRKTKGPVYVLEHPLSRSESDEVATQLRKVCASHGPLQEHWLAWLVVATECGYIYSGSQYWPQLETRIPDWQFSDRTRLTCWFERFAKEFGGARPGGAWARHFNLIAWPITHAILPSDLQVQLSHAIYTARHYLFGLAERTDEEIGNIIAQRWVAHGDRFERLLQRHQFVGTLVRLLLQRNLSDESIHELALQRIVRDVETHSEARSWLRDAREVCRPTLRTVAPSAPASQAHATQPRFSPELLLDADAQGTWNLWVQPPSAIGLIAETPSVRRAIKRLRFQVAGNALQAFPAADLERSLPRRRPLAVFPSPNMPVLQFLPTDDPDAELLSEDCRVPARLWWVFKKRGDGTAWLQATTALSPGSTYFIGTLDPAQTPPGTPVATSCGDLHLSRLTLEETVNATDAESLVLLGFAVRRTAILRPWGILPRLWREDGQAEYVLGEPILLRVLRDHDFESVRIAVDGGAPSELSCVQSGPFVIEASGLEVGSHRLTIDTLTKRRSGTVVSTDTIANTTLHVHVRAPSVWQPGVVPSEALAVSLSPPNPTLDQLLEREVTLSVEGAADDSLQASLVILASDGARHEHLILRRRAPITATEWGERLDATLRDSDAPMQSLSAIGAHLEVGSAHFGWHRADLVVFPRSLRWGLERRGNDFTARLFSDGDAVSDVTFYPHEAPCTAGAVEFAEVHRGLVARDGLYVAHLHDTCAGLVVSAPPPRMDLSQWKSAEALQITETDRTRLIVALAQWDTASIVGRLCYVRRSQVVKAIRKQLLMTLAGWEWVQAEQRAVARGQLVDLDVVVDPANRNFGIALGRLCETAEIESWHPHFVKTSTRFGITADHSRATLAWRLVFEPENLSDAERTAAAVKDRALTVLVRGARLMQLRLGDGRSLA